jgi:hypothetical protein
LWLLSWQCFQLVLKDGKKFQASLPLSKPWRSFRGDASWREEIFLQSKLASAQISSQRNLKLLLIKVSLATWITLLILSNSIIKTHFKMKRILSAIVLLLMIGLSKIELEKSLFMRKIVLIVKKHNQ